MDKLTTRRSDERAALICEGCQRPGYECISCETLQKALDRLAAYEDTGLTPEDVENLRAAETLRDKAQITKVFGLTAERVHELAKAEAEGRLLALPCKTGQTVYVIDGHAAYVGKLVAWRLLRGELVADVTYRKIGTWATSVAWGKTVFLTREEAEAELRRRT